MCLAKINFSKLVNFVLCAYFNAIQLYLSSSMHSHNWTNQNIGIEQLLSAVGHVFVFANVLPKLLFIAINAKSQVHFVFVMTTECQGSQFVMTSASYSYVWCVIVFSEDENWNSFVMVDSSMQKLLFFVCSVGFFLHDKNGSTSLCFHQRKIKKLAYKRKRNMNFKKKNQYPYKIWNGFSFKLCHLRFYKNDCRNIWPMVSFITLFVCLFACY